MTSRPVPFLAKSRMPLLVLRNVTMRAMVAPSCRSSYCVSSLLLLPKRIYDNTSSCSISGVLLSEKSILLGVPPTFTKASISWACVVMLISRMGSVPPAKETSPFAILNLRLRSSKVPREAFTRPDMDGDVREPPMFISAPQTLSRPYPVTTKRGGIWKRTFRLPRPPAPAFLLLLSS